MTEFDVVVIGGGPAGLAAAISATNNNASVLIIEREGSLGGILKQCIHDGFGLVRFNEKLSGPEYAERFIDIVNEEKITCWTLSFVTKAVKTDDGFLLSVVTREGIKEVLTESVILATGCRERTAKQVFIHGTRPSGVFTAGTAQNYVNILGLVPTKKCVILGSGDIGLIMARRLTLEGAKVVGVFEAKSEPSGLTRNIHQCLIDYNIPLHLSTTVTKVFGDKRLTGVEIAKVDDKMQVIEGTSEYVECDALILSVGLIPENELGEKLGVKIDKNAKGAACDGQFETSVDGIYTCGNATHVNDLVDYVSESGEIAGKNAAKRNKEPRNPVNISINGNTAYLVPEMLNLTEDNSNTVMYFRTKYVLDNCKIRIIIDGESVFEKKFAHLRPPEMQRIQVDFGKFKLGVFSDIKFEIIAEEKL